MEPSSRVVAVANGDYRTLARLDRAVPDAESLVTVLIERHGFEGVLLPDRLRGDLLNDIDEALADGSLPGGVLIVLWTGHGVVEADRLKLIGPATAKTDGSVATAAELGEYAARTGASQVLVVLDTCYSGRGVPAALVTVDAVLAGRADLSGTWFGVVASARGDEPSRSGAMARELARLLTEGPADPEHRLIWSPYRPMIGGDHLLSALVKEWGEDRHTPIPGSIGDPRPMLRNPLHRPKAPHAVVEHLLQAARGSSTGEVFFTGREEVLEPIVAWTRSRRPGTWVVTGPAGSGKSAVVGRIASLSVPEERARLAAVSPRLDPGESSVDVQVHARGLSTKGAVELMAVQLGLPAGASLYDVLGHAERRDAEGTPLVVLIDGLDEAGDVESRNIAVQLAEPLSREALVLVGSREVPGNSGEPGLLALLGIAAGVTDLGTAASETVRDVRRYVATRLGGVSATMDADLVADEVVAMAQSADTAVEGPFLLARLITSQLRQTPVDTSAGEWRTHLATSVEAALEEDLKQTVLTVDGREHPTAARELLLALACAYGAGMPAEDVWPAVAGALSPTGTVYTRDHAFALLLKLGRHVVAGAVGDQPVYRIAHQRLIDHLRPMTGSGLTRGVAPSVAGPVGQAVADLYSRILDRGAAPRDHAYLWRYTWRHLADAGRPGVELLRSFVARDRAAFLPDLVEALDVVGSRAWWLGSSDEAAELHAEAVELTRELDEPLELAMHLFDLAFALDSSGDAEGADAAASEAFDLARTAADDDPASRLVLAATLTARALSQLRQNNFEAAARLATEAVDLMASAPDDEEVPMAALGGACTIASIAAFSCGDLTRADEFSALAVEAAQDLVADDAWHAGLVDALLSRVQVELITSARQGTPVTTAADQIIDLYRTTGATGTISDVTMADGLRLAAHIKIVAAQEAAGRAEAVALLDDAIALCEPFVAQNVMATTVLAMCLISRAEFTPDPQEKLGRLDTAERRLRRMPESSAIGGVWLGTAISKQVQALLDGSGADLEHLLDRQRTAVELLDTDDRRHVREERAVALAVLGSLLNRTPLHQEAALVAEKLIEERRALDTGTPQTAFALAMALSDFAAAVFLTRPLEALDAAEEGLRLLRAFEAEYPPAQTVLGFCELSRSASLLALNRMDEALRSTEQAIELLDVDPASQVRQGALALALSNHAQILARLGRVQPALASARRAVHMFEEFGPAADEHHALLARISLARALNADGNQAEAEDLLGGAIDRLKSQLDTNEHTIAHLAACLDAAGQDAWDEVLTELDGRPLVAARLRLNRTRPPEEVRDTVQDIKTALEEAGEDRDTIRVAHEAGRARRATDPERFERLWTDLIGELPPWLLIDPILDHLLIAWWNQFDLTRSEAYLAAHPELLDPAVDVLLDEFRGSDDSNSEYVDVLMAFRADAAERGVEVAYAPARARALLDRWFAAENPEGFLAEHHDELLSQDVHAVLDSASGDGDLAAIEALCVLVLATRAEQAVAFQIKQDPAHAVALLQPAWRSSDAERLQALAVLCLVSNEDKETLPEHDEGLAYVATAIAQVLLGDVDEAVSITTDLAAGLTEPATREAALGALADALARHTDRGPDFLRLLQLLGA
ncbi:hypothetical protein ACFWNN_40825 [Lentzea sp. NPDC058450]|uniref:hypothetical protein n=1 Tax=Lentzea sp. NPDC058450 TaxID=3346505 RepID=UPI003651FAEE